MSNDRFYPDIKRLLEQNGAMGVNQLSKELNVPLSTLQKYLDKDQNYFKKNHARKWVLPEVAVNNEMSVVSENYANIVDSQLMSMNALIDTLMSQFRATVTIIEANKPNSTSVAGIAPDIHPQLLKMDKSIKEMYVVFKKYLSKVPEEYRDLIKNVDLHRLSIEMGSKFINSNFNGEISALFLERSVDLSDEVLGALKEYQKGT